MHCKRLPNSSKERQPSPFSRLWALHMFPSHKGLEPRRWAYHDNLWMQARVNHKYQINKKYNTCKFYCSRLFWKWTEFNVLLTLFWDVRCLADGG